MSGGNLFLSAGARNRKQDFYQPQIVSPVADHHLVESNVALFCLQGGNSQPNCPNSLRERIVAENIPMATVFHHVVAIHAHIYGNENAGALRMDWPRAPLPGDADILRASAALGATLAARFRDTGA